MGCYRDRDPSLCIPSVTSTAKFEDHGGDALVIGEDLNVG